MKTKEELIKLSEPLWQIANQDLRNGVNPFAYQIGFVDGYRLADQNTKPLMDKISTLEDKLKAAESVNEWISVEVIPTLSENEEYKEFIVIIDNEVVTGVVFSKRDGYFISHFDTSKTPNKLNVIKYQPLPTNPI